jgi:polyketide synthase 12
LSQAPDVFRTMAGGGHVGKLTFATGAGRVRPDGVVLISGGTGALGLVAADWVSERGARAVALLSRRGEAGLDAVAAERVAELRGRGVRVDVPAVDVTDEAALGAVVRELGLPVRGVIHAAGVLEDALVRSATEAQIGRVVGPKVQGMAALEAVTAGALDLFVAFTSVAGVTGGAGQTAYAAANAWVDERMRERSAAGLPGVAVAWGPWAERGMAATLSADPLVRKFTAAEGRALLEAAVRRGAPATVMAALSPASLTGEVPHVLRSVARARVTRASAAASGAFAQRVGALPASERAAFVRSAVRSDVASVLGLQEAKVGDTTPLQELGMDSLLAVEVRNVLSRRTGERLPATVAFDHPTVEALAAMILGKVAAAPAAEPSARATARTPGAGPIAVVGLSCRFPGGGDDAESYWRLLEAGQPVAQPVPAERWDHAAIYQAGEPAPGRSYASRAGFVTDPVSFDAAFFGISDAEARMLDPQQRMVLELAWEALEDARVPTDRLKDSRTGVYVGAAGNDFAQLLGDRQRTSPYGLTGTDLSFLPGRLAYTLGLRGPAMQVNTVCSSALVAMHHAVRGLQDGDCDLAIAGGVNLLLDGGGMVVLAQIGALSPDGTCKTFSADADGYGRAEGCALVVLKRLADAERDGDRVLGVIRGSAVNNDGRSSGLTAPSGPAQQVVMREALAQTGFGPEAVDFLECHGTGTRLGDPIEVRAAAEVYASTREASNPLLLGSAKGVVGHLEAAAAMAGVVKILLAFRHGVVPPTPVREVNPELPLGEFPLRIVGEVTPWARRAGHVRRAAISSFGLSGTNAHMVFEEPPARAERVVVRGEGPYVWAVSGRSEAQVRANAERLLALDAHPADVAASLLATRAQLEVRGALVGRDLAELRASLAGLEVRRADAVGPVFVFGGQGSQVAGMGAESYAWSPVYRQAFDAAVEACRPWLPEDLRGVVWSADGRLDRTEWTQAGLFCVQVAQAALWRSLGVVPAAVVGHSVGEFAAAVVAGVLPLDVAARLVSVRGRAMGALPAGGAMVAVAASADEVTRELVPGAELAAVNSPRSAVVSGDEDAVAQVAARFAARGVRTTKLVVSHAFHSARMEPALAALRAAAEECRPAAPAVPVVATARSTHAFGTAEYWVDQARTPVWFAEAIARLAAEGRTRFVELGGRPVLGSMIAQSVPESVDAHVVTAADDGGEALAFVRAAAAAWAGGVRLDLRPVVGAGATIGLPAMAWEKRPLWVGATPQTGGVDTQVPLLGVQLPLAGERTTYEARWSPAQQPWLSARAGDRALVPGGAVLEVMRAAAEHARGEGVELTDVVLSSPVPFGGIARVQVQVDPDSVRLFAATGDGGWVEHGRAVVRPASAPPPAIDPTGLRSGRPEPLDELAARAAVASPLASAATVAAWSSQDRVVVELALPAGVPEGSLSLFVDAACAALPEPGLPGELDRYEAVGGTPAWAVATRAGDRWDLELWDAAGAPVAALRGLRVRPLRDAVDVVPTLYREDWVAVAAPAAGAELPAVVWFDEDPVAAALAAERAAAAGPALLVGTGAAAGAAARALVRSLGAPAGVRAVELPAGADALALLGREAAAGDAEPAVRWTADGERRAARLVRDGALVPPDAPSWRLHGAPTGPSALRLVPAERRAPGAGEVELEVVAAAWAGERVGVSGVVAQVGSGVEVAVGDRVSAALSEAPGRFVIVAAAAVAAVAPDVGDAAAAVATARGSDAARVGPTPLLPLATLAGRPDGAAALGAGRVRPDGVAVVVGGGALAAESVDWLIGRGARAVVWAGQGDAVEPREGAWRAAGASVVRSDAEPTDAAALRAAVAATGLPLRAVAWSGGVGDAVATDVAADPFASGGVRSPAFGVRWAPVRAAGALPPRVRVLGDDPGGFVEALVGAGVVVADDAPVTVDLRLYSAPLSAASLALLRDLAGPRWVVVLPPEGPDAWGHLAAARSARADRPSTRVDLALATDGAGLTLALRTGEGEVRVVDGAASAPRLEPLAPSAPADVAGRWLVTGGTGALGLEFAGWLAARGATGLVLASRRGLPADDPRWARLRSLPCPVHVAAVDVTDEGAVRTLLAEHPVDGVIHAAGADARQGLDALDAATSEALLHGKVRGAATLDKVLGDRGAPLGFVLVGSISAVWGSRDLVGYSAANGALEGLARARRARGAAAQCLAFGPWGGGGMIDAAAAAELARAGLEALEPAPTLDTVGRLLGGPDAVVVRARWAHLADVLEGVPGARSVVDALAAQVADPAAPSRPSSADAVVRGFRAAEALATGADLDVFVAHLSASAVLGAAAAATLSSAHGYVLGRVRELCAAGWPASAVAWGGHHGPRRARATLEALARRGSAATLATTTAPSAPDGAVPALLRSLVRVRTDRAAAAAGGLFARQVAALPPSERDGFVLSAVRADVARVLGVPEARVDASTPLQELGHGQPPRHRAAQRCWPARVGERLPATLAFDHPTVGALTRVPPRAPRRSPAQGRRRRGAAPPRREPDRGRRHVLPVPRRGRRPRRVLGAAARARGPSPAEVPADRWDHAAVYSRRRRRPRAHLRARRAAFVRDPAGFDARFFGITDAEAGALDPQQRLFLEVGWEALEDAGLARPPRRDAHRRVPRRRGDRLGRPVRGCTDVVAVRRHRLRPLVRRRPRSRTLLGLRGPGDAVTTACVVARRDARRGPRAARPATATSRWPAA